MNTLRQSSASNLSPPLAGCATTCRTAQWPDLSSSITVREFRPGPPLAVMAVFPEALTTNPNGPAPVKY